MPELDLASDDRSPADRVSVTVHLDPTDWSDHLAAETARGLSDAPPWIPPVWFYDEVGSKLFDQITRLAEYYPTEAELRFALGNHGVRTKLTQWDYFWAFEYVAC